MLMNQCQTFWTSILPRQNPKILEPTLKKTRKELLEIWLLFEANWALVVGPLPHI